MRVISQDGKHDFPYENVIIKLSDDGFVFANFVNGQPFLVAQYSSVEKSRESYVVASQNICKSSIRK